MKRKFSLFVFVLFLLNLTGLYAQSQGESLFKENKPKEAAKVLENEILNGIVSANTYNFLGLSYYQAGEYAKSIDAFNRGITAQPSLTKILTYNQGNSYFAMKDYMSAVGCYSKVVLEDPQFNEAKLNKANALLMAGQLVNAKDEYVNYIEECPEDAQRSKIEELIKVLEEEILRREEEDRAKWEQYDASLEEPVEDEMLAEWEKVDASIPAEKEDEKDETPEEDKDDWENVEAKIPEETKEPEEKPDWEEVNAPIAENKEEKSSDIDWEKVAMEKELAQKNNIEETLVEDDSDLVSWQGLGIDDEEELKYLDETSKAEHEKWLAEQKRLLKETEDAKRKRELEEKLKEQAKKDQEEQDLRDRVMTEMMRAENERKQKLLDDLANSLMNSESTDITSGADDIMEYDLEGELD